MEEQLSFTFEKPSEKPKQPAEESHEYDFAEKDECSRCGNPFESTGSCVECARNEIKITYLEKLKKKIN